MERDLIEEWALALYDHFNPEPEREIKVPKSVCIRMAEVALRHFKRSQKLEG